MSGMTSLVQAAGVIEHKMETVANNLANVNTIGFKEDQPSWSPDGTKITFYTYLDGNAEIYVMDADGSNLTRLTNAPTADWFPSWSPDGQKIAFVSKRSGSTAIYVMNADGSNQTRLTYL